MNKKGVSLESMYPAVLTIIIVGILLGVGIYTLDSVAEGVANTEITVTNETINLDDGGSLVVPTYDCQARDFVLTEVLNDTGVVPANNYTFVTTGQTTGLLTLDGTGDDNGTIGNISYTYTGTTYSGTNDACTRIGTSITGIGGLADWIAVIVVVLAAAIVLGIVISSFGRRNSA